VTVDRDKLRTKLQFILDAVRRLEDIRARGEEALLTDSILEAAAVRNLQVAIEAMLDAAHHIIAREGLGIPTSYRQTLEILLSKGILPADRGTDLLRLVSFRNRAVHLYDRIDPREVARILEHQLEDFGVFVTAIAQTYLTSEEEGPSG
jgi:uncharacterized protein YutE (UPF0331/DUF86 family)